MTELAERVMRAAIDLICDALAMQSAGDYGLIVIGVVMLFWIMLTVDHIRAAR